MSAAGHASSLSRRWDQTRMGPMGHMGLMGRNAEPDPTTRPYEQELVPAEFP
jgi:hypothetical protein